MLAGASDHRNTTVLTELVAAAATDASLRPHLHDVSETWQVGIETMLRAAQDRGELVADAAVPLLAEALSAFTLRRVMFQNPPIDHTLRANLHALVQHPPLRA